MDKAVPITRRQWMGGSLVAATSLGLGAPVASAAVSAPPAASDPRGRTRAMRFAHMTDTHLMPERSGDQGFAEALQHVQGLDDPPELIINGGDAIMDAFAATEQRTKLQWDLWHRVLANECSLPMLHCIGNHDLWGWNRTRSRSTGDEPKWGKQWPIEEYEIKERYYSVDRGGWHFIILDSTQPRNGGYTAYVDEEQMDWLRKDLAATDPQTPAVIVSHIPILTVTSFYEKNRLVNNQWTVPDSWMHRDAVVLRDLFRKHRNVKLCLSGHMHQVDELYFDQVGYCCSGAVSGSWWRGKYHGFDAGYALVDLYTDGSYDYQFVQYGWTPRD